MLFSYKTLCRLANLENVSIEKVVSAINSIGFEVEEYHKFADVEGIKLCHVIKAYKNPNADRLTVCEIEFADGSHSIIQTTATNMKDGDYVMAFVPGSRSKGQVFSARTMQGIVSEGMFVGLSELGFQEEQLPEEHKSGIFQVGKIDLNINPIEYFDLNDYLIDVSILSNRYDSACYLVFARELAAYFNTSLKEIPKPKPVLKSSLHVGELNETNSFILVEANAKNFELDIREKILLWKHGIKTFNNAIDLSNLVLLYTGVPCHVYDKNKLKSNIFSTKFSSENVNILGNHQVKLDNNLVVKNGNDTVAIAATIGIHEFEYDKNSSQAIFELASFNLKEVRKNAKQLKIETNSSNRASREIASGALSMAYDFLCQYLDEYSEQINAPKIRKKTILLDKSYINKLAGFNITKTKKYEEVISKLETLDFKFKSDRSALSFPIYRYDLNTIQDFVEELFRFYGYENFTIKVPKVINTYVNNNVESHFNYFMASKEYLNVKTYTLINPEENIFNPFNFENAYNAEASKNYNHSQIRFSLISSLLNCIVHNQKQGMPKSSFFEIAMIHNQMNVLGIVSDKKTFSEIKKDVISLTNEQLIFKNSNNPIFNPHVSTEIYYQDKMIGYIAKLHPKFNHANLIFAEIMLDKITNLPIKYKKYKHTPLKSRDLTINLAPKESLNEILEKINALKGIHSVEIKDTYFKEDGFKNITITIILEEWATKKFDTDFNK
ncbi:phenylalanine--tRNA ligase subunit beta [[Mycoplasma] phocae]|uniref:Phenylalanine--tRNA ligase beta subunit n=1 Tax=[Mycoplasma] phocae TaxID=142651 RepID=A0A2Z5IQQ5_9BACT|nr:phenylalanine--tRNA ligase subunit beta [[Mycoplasma] phocae]AXE60887.1 phenylalanine--tRNA ligase subunit beta [[Mycoplasma] phocae]